jgi:hypothetical protein
VETILQNSDKIEEIKDTSRYYFQVDFLKAVMIFLVIFDHTIPWSLKENIGVALWERISIPVFLVIMGFNMGLSFRRVENPSLRTLYSSRYFKGKFWRYIYPFIVLWIVSSLIGLSINGVDALNQYRPGWNFFHLFIGILPFWGPGNWFLPVIFWTILIMPLLYKGFSGKLLWRILSLVLCYAIELSLQFAIFFRYSPFSFSTWGAYYEYLYTLEFIFTTPFFMLSAIGLGMWFSKKPNLFAKQNLFMWILFPLSLFYLIQYQFFGFRFEFIRTDYHLLVSPYSAFLVLLVIKLLPMRWDNWFGKAISTIGKSTYHILLTQILYFAVVVSLYGDHYRASIFGINFSDNIDIFLYLIINWVICIPCGVFWHFIDEKLLKYIKLRNNL